MTIKYILLTAALIAALLNIGVTNTVSAAEGESIVMSPASSQLQLNAGETSKKSFSIINDGTVTLDFKVYAAPYSVKNDSYTPDFTSERANTDIYSWITFSQKSWKLEPGKTVEIFYEISVPRDAAPGGHYGVIFAETQANNQDQGQIKRQKRVGAIMYGVVNGDYIQAGREIETVIPSFKIGGVPSAMMTVENTGNAHFVSKETFRVKNILGEKVYERTMEHIILPKTTRDIGLVWEKGANLGWYTVETQSVILGKTVSHSGLVFVAPLWFLVIVALVIFGIIYMLWRRFRR